MGMIFKGEDDEERILKAHREDSPMFGGSERYDKIKETLRLLKDSGRDISEMSLEDVRRIADDKDFKFK